MELRSSRKKQDETEYMELRSKLHGMGAYEAGMELLEMRQLMAALQDSVYEKDSTTDSQEQGIEMTSQKREHSAVATSMINSDNEQASSTMPNNNFHLQCSSSPFTSPGKSPEIVITQAQVYYENDWSPPAPRIHPPTPISTAIHPRRQVSQMESITDVTFAIVDGEQQLTQVADDGTFNLAPEELLDSGVSSYFSSTATNGSHDDGSSSVCSHEETNSQVEPIDQNQNVYAVNDYNYNRNVDGNDEDDDGNDSSELSL